MTSPSAFQGGLRVFTVDDILSAAEWRGVLADFRTDWSRRLTSARTAEAEGLAPDAAAIEAATDAFRYARDLVSADECDRWLGDRGLTFEDLTASVTRRLQAEMSDPVEGCEPEADDEPIFLLDALLADEFTVWARDLAWRVALACEEKTLPSDPNPEIEIWPELEERFVSAGAALITPDRRKRELAAQRLRFLRVTVEVAEFDSDPAAREAVLCAREAGSSLAGIAGVNGFPCQTVAGFLGDLPEGWRPALISARPGDVVRPPDADGGIIVLNVLNRQEPALDDVAVCERLDTELRDRHFSELESRHIRWLINVELTS